MTSTIYVWKIYFIEEMFLLQITFCFLICRNRLSCEDVFRRDKICCRTMENTALLILVFILFKAKKCYLTLLLLSIPKTASADTPPNRREAECLLRINQVDFKNN